MVMVMRLPFCFDAVEPEGEADGRNAVRRAEEGQEFIEAAAACQNRRRSLYRHLKDETGVVIERPPESGAIVEAGQIDAGIGKGADATIETGERIAELQAGGIGKTGQRRRRIDERHVQRQELFQHMEGRIVETRFGQDELFLEPPGDLQRRAAGIGRIARRLHFLLEMGDQCLFVA